MTFKQAKRLHNEDEVIAKDTGESIRVLSIEVKSVGKHPVVLIEGYGNQSGYQHWLNREVK